MPDAFGQEWKTRLVWSADELAQIEAERRRLSDAARRVLAVEPPQAARPAAPLKPSPKPPTAAAKIAAPVAAGAPVSTPAAAPPKPAPVRAVSEPPARAPSPGLAPKPEMAHAAPPTAPQPVPASAAAAVRQPPAPARAVPAKPVADPEATLMRPPAEPVLRGLRLSGPVGVFVLEPGRHVVGRAETAAVPILDSEVSRSHAVLTLTAHSASVEDAKSANGTFVNGKSVEGQVVPLKTGDRVAFGSVEFIVELMS
jgi:hypothetical protein